jgi:hypothetical protein
MMRARQPISCIVRLAATVMLALVIASGVAWAQRGSRSDSRRSPAKDTAATSGVPPATPYTMELWLHAMRQQPSVGDAALGVTLDGTYLFAPRAHDRWRRNVSSEVLAQPTSLVRVELGYDPQSALVTGSGGFHLFAEGSYRIGENNGGGVYARYDRAGSQDDAIVSDFELGAEFSHWSDERRTFANEKVGYRRLGADMGTGIDDGIFVQARHYLVYVPSEDWGLTYVQEASGRVGIGGDPHTNQLRVVNTFLVSPSLAYSIGPIVGVDLEYFVGPATSTLTVPVGARGELHPGPVVIGATAIYDVATISGQRTSGLLLRISAGLRF